MIDRTTLLDAFPDVFGQLSEPNRRVLENPKEAFGCTGHWIACVSAFCQVVRQIPGGPELLEAAVEHRDSFANMRKVYGDLRNLVEGVTNEVIMSDIVGKSVTDMETLYVEAHTWEKGGRPVWAPCGVFIRALGYCAPYSYGECLAGVHKSISSASWASALNIHFIEAIKANASVDEVSAACKEALKAAKFDGQRCDIRLWHHRFGDSMASLVAGGIIAALISMGSTCGTWVAVTAAAVADPKPVAGFTSAAWGYPPFRRSHFEARSPASIGNAAVTLKSDHPWTSCQPDIAQDIVWQILVSFFSTVVLAFKFDIRDTLGFKDFAPPQIWVFWLGIGLGLLGALISIQIPQWALTHGKRWSLVHGLMFPIIEITAFAVRLIWRSSDGIVGVRNFWIADMLVWIHAFLGATYSMHLGQSTEYPVTGWLWPTTWLFAVSSCGAGIPRPSPS